MGPHPVKRSQQSNAVRDDVSQDERSLKYGFARAIFLAAIGLATLGWLWLFAWIARKLFEIVFE